MMGVSLWHLTESDPAGPSLPAALEQLEHATTPLLTYVPHDYLTTDYSTVQSTVLIVGLTIAITT